MGNENSYVALALKTWNAQIDRPDKVFGRLSSEEILREITPGRNTLFYLWGHLTAQAFIEEDSGFPKHLARRVHDLYFQPLHEEFHPRTMWSLSNAFTSAFKELDPIPQYKATAKLAGFLQSVRPS